MAEIHTDPRKNFVPRFLPRLLAAAALVFYTLTLNHWISLLNLGVVAGASGWVWQPQYLNPVFYLVTLPIHWLPATKIPIVLNLFSAVCAALTLGLLARSVAILPQDRTEAQRQREISDFSFLTHWGAWLPPVLAVMVCGLQLTFWEHATNGSGEMFELLLFAFVIWSILEYRLDEREWRLYLAVFVYGAGIVDSWTTQSPNGSALMGFFPLFLAAIIWTRRLSFFNVQFLRRMFFCGFVGMLFYFLLPTLAMFSHRVPVTFWEMLKMNLGPQLQAVKLIFNNSDFRYSVGLLSLTSLLPVLIMAIRWPSTFGDSSKLGQNLTTFMFHLVQAIILGVCLWVAFDPPFSPRHLGFGLPFSTFYYLGALGIGYFSGYFLIVFAKPVPTPRAPRPRPSPFDILYLPALCGLSVLAVFAAIGLFYRNAPQIRQTNGDTWKTYAAVLEKNLPREGYLLSDDLKRLTIVQAALARDGRSKDFVPLDTHSLPYPAYERFLHEKFPQKWPEMVSVAQTNTINPLGLIVIMASLAKSNDVCYLHPSFGYYFEEFYLEPHGLIYRLKILPNETLLPPPLDKKLIEQNEQFWSDARATVVEPIEDALAPEPGENGLVQRMFARLRLQSDPNPETVLAGTLYSRSLNFWGVQLQRAGYLTNATERFKDALALNPDNVVAEINLDFNQKLLAGEKVPVDLSQTTADRFGKYRSWMGMINDNGSFDEPSFCFEDGYVLSTQNGYFRQSVAPMERVRQLSPDFLPARLFLAQIYLISQLPDRALDVLREPLEQSARFTLTASNSTELNVLAAGAYFQKNDNARSVRLLQVEISRHPDDDTLITATARAYMMKGLYTNALALIDFKLKNAPTNSFWIYNHGYASMQLKNYNKAITDFNRVLESDTNNGSALFNRALAYLQSDKLDAARADYQKLQTLFTNSFQVAYGLGEIAWRKHETNEVIHNYRIYLANANTNTDEAKTVFERLHQLNVTSGK